MNLDGKTILEKGKLFSDYKDEHNLTWAQVAAAFADSGLTEDTVRGYGGRYRRQCEERERQQERQIEIVRHGGKAPRFDRPRVLLRSAVFDIETTDFGTAGYKGHLICCSILPTDSDDVQTIQIEFDEPDDRRVLVETIQALSVYDVLIGHNIIGFDLGWLSSRLAYHNLPPFRRWFAIDTYIWSKRAKLKTRKKLSTLIDYFGVPGIKTSVEESSWNNIRSRWLREFEDARDDIVYHCELDVRANRSVFEALYPLVMASRYSSSSPIAIFDQGAGAGMSVYEDELQLAAMLRRIAAAPAARRAAA